MKKVRPFNPTIDFLKSLHINQIPSGLASDSEKEIIQAILRQLRLEPYFQVTLSSCEVGSGKPKPAPDVFLECGPGSSKSRQAFAWCLKIPLWECGRRSLRVWPLLRLTVSHRPLIHGKISIWPNCRQADLHLACMEEFNLMPRLNQFDIRRRAKGNHESTRKSTKSHEI